MPYSVLAIIALTASCIIFLPLILFASLKIRKDIKNGSHLSQSLDDSTIEKIVAKISAPRREEESVSIDELNTHITQIRKDFDWLVSDRMIEQAIELAKMGADGEYITNKTGISAPEMYAMNKHRRH